MPSRSNDVPFQTAGDVPAAFALIQGDDLQAPTILKGDEVVFVDEAPETGDLAVIVMRPELAAKGGRQCLVLRLRASIPPRVTFPWNEGEDSTARMLLVVSQTNPVREFALRCDQILAVRKFSHVQKRAKPLPVAELPSEVSEA